MAKVVLLNAGDAQERRLSLLEGRIERHALVLDELAGRVLELEKAVDLAWVHQLTSGLAAQVDTYAREVRAFTERFNTLEREAAAAAGAGAAEPREEER